MRGREGTGGEGERGRERRRGGREGGREEGTQARRDHLLWLLEQLELLLHVVVLVRQLRPPRRDALADDVAPGLLLDHVVRVQHLGQLVLGRGPAVSVVIGQAANWRSTTGFQSLDNAGLALGEGPLTSAGPGGWWGTEDGGRSWARVSGIPAGVGTTAAVVRDACGGSGGDAEGCAAAHAAARVASRTAMRSTSALTEW